MYVRSTTACDVNGKPVCQYENQLKQYPKGQNFVEEITKCVTIDSTTGSLPFIFIYPQNINSFIHSGYFYSAPSSPLLLRGAPDYSTDTVSEFHAEAHRQLQVKDLPK